MQPPPPVYVCTCTSPCTLFVKPCTWRLCFCAGALLGVLLTFLGVIGAVLLYPVAYACMLVVVVACLRLAKLVTLNSHPRAISVFSARFQLRQGMEGNLQGTRCLKAWLSFWYTTPSCSCVPGSRCGQGSDESKSGRQPVSSLL